MGEARLLEKRAEFERRATDGNLVEVERPDGRLCSHRAYCATDTVVLPFEPI